LGKTIVEKILSKASGTDAKAGDRVWAEVDIAQVRDFGGPNVALAFEEYTGGGKVHDPKKIAITFDLHAPAKDQKQAANQRLLRDFAHKQGIEALYDVDKGIGQHVLLEDGKVLPGGVIIGADSHMNILGAVGSFSVGCGTTDIVAAWATGKLWFRVPDTMKIIFRGRYEPPTSAKDLTLKMVSELGADGAAYRAVEFEGEMLESFGLAERLTLCSMVTETDGKIGFLKPSPDVLEFLRSRLEEETGEFFDASPDADASYIEERVIDVDGLEPLISCPHAPENVKPVAEVAGTKIDEAFIGSCTNGRIEDLRAAAEVFEKLGGCVDPDVRLIITPATAEVALEALREGLTELFMCAGAIVTNPGCSLCTIGHHGVLGPGDVLISTSNRNFPDKLGKGGQVYLASPATVAASAIAGEIALPPG
jgi:3-isopropylmalate/(R)-2-methylmalate dehydratase large subunit